MKTDGAIRCNQAVAQFYDKYFNAIQMYIGSRVSHKYEAEDLAQDVFMRLLGCGQVINHATAGSFLFTIAHNLVTDVQRRYDRRKAVMAEWGLNTAFYADVTEQEIAVRELADIYRMQVCRLPPARRKVYELVNNSGWHVDEVATHMNLSVRTVECHLYHARKDIRTHLGNILQAV